MKKNPDYEAGFRRIGEDDLFPEERAALARKNALHKRLMIAGVAVLVLAGGAGAAYQLTRDTPAKQLARARTLIANNDHPSALIELKRSLQGDAQQPEARFLLGQELSRAGDFKGAGIEFQKALEGGVAADRALPPLVDSALRQGDFDRVVTLVNNATTESAAVNAELQTSLGTAYMGLQKVDAGKMAYVAAKEYVPNYSGALIAEARYLVGQQQLDAASALLAKVPDDDKRQDDLQMLKGDIARLQHQPQQAIAAYEKAAQFDPANMGARLNLAQTYIEVGDLDRAKAAIDVVVKTVPGSGRAQFVSALTAYLRKDIPAAREAIDRAVQLTPGDVTAQVLAGVIDLQQNELVGAETHLRQAIQIVPEIVQARQYLAELYLQRYQPNLAEEVYRPVLAALPADRDVATLAARIALQQGNLGKASQLFDRIGILKSNDAKASIVSASLRFAAGNPAAGFEQLKAAAQANPDDPEIDVAIVTHRLQLRQIEPAMAAWRVLQAKQPSNARTWSLLALIDRARNDPAAARRSLEKSLSLDPQHYAAVAGLVSLDLQEKKVDEARQLLRTFIAADPKPTEALLALARIEAEHGAGEATVEGLLKDAQKRSPDSQHVVDELIAFHAVHRNVGKQLAAAQQGLTIAPNNQFYLVTAGDLLQRAGDLPGALAMYTRLNALNNEYPDFPLKLGVAQLQAGQTEAALTTLRNLIKRNPKNIDLQVRSVAAFLETGKSEEAGRMLFEVSQVAPDSPMIPEFDADIKVAKKQFPEAVAGYKRAMTTFPNSKLVIKMTKVHDLAKQRSDGNAVLADWMKSHPKDELVIAFDAERSLANKEFDRAASLYRKLVDAHPKNAALLNNYAWALGQRKDPQAVSFAEQAVALAPDDVDAADTLGALLVQNGNAARGIDLIQKASDRAPGRLEIKLHLAKAQIGDGRKDAARGTLQALIAAAPQSPEARESKALIDSL